MGSTDGKSINTNRLEYMWKVEMRRGESIKEGGDYERGIRKLREKYCNNREPNL